MHQIYVEHYTECMETNCNDKTYVRTQFHRKIKFVHVNKNVTHAKYLTTCT